jgi:hypothetical protein
MDLELVRDVAEASFSYGTITIGSLVLQTLELPWRPEPGSLCGRPDRSCLPAATYQLALHDSAAHPKTWALVNEDLNVYHELPANLRPGCIARSACLIHVANYVSQLEGCIAVGRNRSDLSQVAAIWQSADAFRALQSVLPWTGGHVLTISYAAGVTPP